VLRVVLAEEVPLHAPVAGGDEPLKTEPLEVVAEVVKKFEIRGSSALQ